MQSRATTVGEYLAELPPDRRRAIETLRKLVLANIDRKNIEEGMLYGMIGYYIPHRVYPKGYHCTPDLPLAYLCLASQKNYLSLYMCLYEGTPQAKEFRDAWAKTGKKLDMGKCCVRFRKVEDLALDVIADTIRKSPVQEYISRYEATINEPRSVRAKRRKQAAAKKLRSSPRAATAKKATTKKFTPKNGALKKPVSGRAER